MINKRLVITFPSTDLDFRALSNIKNMEECISAPSGDLENASSDFENELQSILNRADIQEVSLIMSNSASDVRDQNYLMLLKNQLTRLNNIPLIAENLKNGRIKTSAFVYSKMTGLFDEVAIS